MTPYRTYFAIVGFAGCILVGMLWLTPKGAKPVVPPQAKIISTADASTPSVTPIPAAPSTSVETVIVLTKNGSITMGGARVTLPQLQQKLSALANAPAHRAIVLRYDKNAPFQSIHGVIDACHAAQLTNIAFVSRSPDPGSGQE